MMYADPHNDLPASWRQKRVIFYQQGLKIYGQIPYLLQRRLQATFVSNVVSTRMSVIAAPTGEDNYTLVPYRRSDGTSHRLENIEALMDWLYGDSGFEWSIAVPGEYERRDLLTANWFNRPPETWLPAEGYRTLLSGLFLEEGDVR